MSSSSVCAVVGARAATGAIATARRFTAFGALTLPAVFATPDCNASGAMLVSGATCGVAGVSPPRAVRSDTTGRRGATIAATRPSLAPCSATFARHATAPARLATTTTAASLPPRLAAASPAALAAPTVAAGEVAAGAVPDTDAASPAPRSGASRPREALELLRRRLPATPRLEGGIQARPTAGHGPEASRFARALHRVPPLSASSR